ncbi:LCP family protein [Pseudonocardia benzenivorans]|uniref:LCP family protein n=1 Tax=Pseudonocardia benzenivorans TaxID=228005 RepID=A0ABW3VD32_9PSEU
MANGSDRPRDSSARRRRGRPDGRHSAEPPEEYYAGRRRAHDREAEPGPRHGVPDDHPPVEPGSGDGRPVEPPALPTGILPRLVLEPEDEAPTGLVPRVPAPAPAPGPDAGPPTSVLPRSTPERDDPDAQSARSGPRPPQGGPMPDAGPVPPAPPRPAAPRPPVPDDGPPKNTAGGDAPAAGPGGADRLEPRVGATPARPSAAPIRAVPRGGPATEQLGRVGTPREVEPSPRDAGTPRRHSEDEPAADAGRPESPVVAHASGDPVDDPVDLASPDDDHVRRRRIDEGLTRLTAAHEDPDGDPPEPVGPGATRPRRPRRPRPPGPVPSGGPFAAGLSRRQRVVRSVTIAAVLVVFLALTVGWTSKLTLEGAVRQVAALDPQSGAILDAAAQNGAQNVLVLGVDTTGGPDPGSDSIVVAHVPAGGGPLTSVSFPRDLEINRPPCQRWDPGTASYLDQTVPAEARTKIDTAFRVGGPACAVRTVQQLSGLSITGFVAVDLPGLGAMATALGGVTVCLDRPVVDSVLGTVAQSTGPSTVDGPTVDGLVRARHVQGDPPSDEGLVDRQQRVLAAALDRALSTSRLLNPWSSHSFGAVLARSTTADGMDVDQILATARALRGDASDPGQFVTVPTTGEINTRGNSVLRDRDATALFKALRTGAAIPPAALAPPSTSAVPAPSAVTVDVLNASERPGLAQDVASKLRAVMFGIGTVGNAPTPGTATVIRFSPDRAAEAQVVAAAVPSARSVPDASASGVLQLVLGDSFDGTIRAVGQQSPDAPPPGPAPPSDCT